MSSRSRYFFLADSFRIVENQYSKIISSHIIHTSPNISCPMSDNQLPPVNVPVLSPHCDLNQQSFSQPLRYGDKTSPSDSVHHKPAPSAAFLLRLICNTYSILHHGALRYTGSLCFGSESSVSFSLHTPAL